VGLAGGFGNTSGRASATNAVSHSPAPDYSQTLVIPTSSLPSRYSKSARNGHTIYVNPAAPTSQPQPESLSDFLARCAIVSAIVWIASFLMRRTRNLGVRLAFVAAGLLLLALAAMVPLHLTDRSAQAAIPN